MDTLRVTLVMTALLGTLSAACPASAGTVQGSGSVVVGAEVRERTRVQIDRPLVTLSPGQTVTVNVILKARVAPGEVVALVLDAGLPGGAQGTIAYQAGGRAGQLAGPTVVSEARGSGVRTVPVALTLSPRARGPVTLPLALQATIGNAPHAVASATRVQP